MKVIMVSKRLLAGSLVVALVMMLLPSAALAGGVSRGAGAQVIAGSAGSQQPEMRGQAGLQVKAEASEVVGSVQACRQMLQELQRVRKQTEASWQVAWRALREELARLRKQFRMEIREETRAQIIALFKEAVQLLKEEGKLSELEDVLKDMIAMVPADAESYKELGKIYRQRGEKAPKVFCDGNELKPDVPPVIKEGRTLIPVRALTEALGATVEWNEKERTVLVTKGDVRIQIQVDNRVAFVNGERVELDVPAQNICNRVFVPLRFLSQALKAKVDYYPEGQVVVVNQGDAQAQE